MNPASFPMWPSPHAKPKKRTFTTEYKLAILEESDRATMSGQVTLLLRRVGLYSSHLSNWRKWRDRLEKDTSPLQLKSPSQAALGREVDKLGRQNQLLQRQPRQPKEQCSPRISHRKLSEKER